MRTGTKIKGKLSQRESDTLVASEADDDSKWGKPIRMHSDQTASLEIPARMAARAAFLARLDRQSNTWGWLRQIIEERVELEKAALAGAKRELSAKNGK